MIFVLRGFTLGAGGGGGSKCNEKLVIFIKELLLLT